MDMETNRAHERITSLEDIVREHIDNHRTLEEGLAENTELTRTISENTSELVSLIKGVKGFRGFVLWLAPFIAALTVIGVAGMAIWHWIKTQAGS